MVTFSKKLSPELKKLILTSETVDKPSDLSLIIRIHGNFTSKSKIQLESIGALIITVSGDITTLKISSEALDKLAQIDFVKYIELSRPLFLE